MRATIATALDADGRVAVLGVEPLSGGASRVRLGGARGVPASVVVKAGGAGRAPGAGERERRFLAEIAPALRARLPRVLATVRPAGDGPPLVVLEDLAPLRPGDQLAGVEPAALAGALEQIALVHAGTWGGAGLERRPWLDRGPREWPALAALMPDLVARFCERHATVLAGPELAAVERFAACAGSFYAAQPAPWSLCHGDLRAAHVLSDARRTALVDWQAVALGPAVADVAFLVGGSLAVADRRGHEIALLRGYHGALQAAGVTGYPWDRCFADYRRHALGGVLRMIASAAGGPHRPATPRGDALLRAMAERHVAHADDLESAAVL